ncbi:MAG: two component transcriptional regulator, LuxR family [Dehalococcoidales bacterium]|nr:two component transcriptional regulator, LuxR family [Dehalococcoidales bacterium]
MRKDRVRVIIAAEFPQVRQFLRGVIEEEHGVTVVGQAANATKALSLARSLRPDVAIIDCYLPYIVGLDSVPLSRIGGLDIAQTISAEIPNVRVLVVGNLNERAPAQLALVSGAVGFLPAGKEREAPVRLRRLYEQAQPAVPIVFANINIPSRTVLRQKVSDVSEQAIVLGGLGVLAGLSLTFNVSLASAGVILTLVGGSVALLGLAAKLAVAVWPRAIGKPNELSDELEQLS